MEKQHPLTQEQREHFLEHGWVKIPQAIPKENVDLYTNNVWVRLGYDKDDPSTWDQERFRIPRHREIPWPEFAPKAWGAMCDIVGGEDRIDKTMFYKAGDCLIVNLGAEEWRDKTIHPKDLGNWHVDGNWFHHYLDSSEQCILCVVLYSDVAPRAGGTFICEDGLKPILQWLHDRPQGESWKDMFDTDRPKALDAVQHCEKFVECTGKAGDVYIFHGCMPHSASKNHLRIPRFITSPRLALKEPFNFNRENPEDYSLVELKTLRELGVSSLPNWKASGERIRFVAANNQKREARLPLELERLKAHAAKTGGVVDSIHLNGTAHN